MTMTTDPIVIVGYARTPMGAFQGDFRDVVAPELGAVAIRSALSRANLQGTDVDEVLMGCVLPAGLGQAPARQAAIGAGIPHSTPATTINKMCGSGLKTIMLGHDALLAGSAKVVVAGGMESMSNSPYLLPKARIGYRLGHGEVKDHMFLDGLEDAYDKGRLMGTFAEDTAEKYKFSREEQDAYALESLTRAKKAIANNAFKNEIAPVIVHTRTGETLVSLDEQPGKAKPEKIAELKPAFRKNGTVTAANSSSISDGAAAMVLMRMSESQRRKITPLAILRGHSTHAQNPAWFTTAPIKSIEKVLKVASWKKDEIDFFEINEAFAVVAMAAIHDLKLDHSKVNIYGGACALGHPIGASGARIAVTLLSALRACGKKKGIASLCIGGGEAVSVALEKL